MLIVTEEAISYPFALFGLAEHRINLPSGHAETFSDHLPRFGGDLVGSHRHGPGQFTSWTGRHDIENAA